MQYQTIWSKNSEAYESRKKRERKWLFFLKKVRNDFMFLNNTYFYKGMAKETHETNLTPWFKDNMWFLPKG